MNAEKQEKFLGLLEPNLSRLERFILIRTRNRDEAKDILAETVLKAFEGFGKLREEQAFLSYLFTIADRIYKRRAWRGRFWDKSYRDENFASLSDDSRSPEDLAEIALLHEAIGRLPAKTRDAIIMHELLDMPLEEVRKVQGGSLSGVKVRLMRGRKKLAKMLGLGKASEDGEYKPEEIPPESLASIRHISPIL